MPTNTIAPTTAPRCAPQECGACGWLDSAGLCHESEPMPNGQMCCYKTCQANRCVVVSGQGIDSCVNDASCIASPIPTVGGRGGDIAYKCDQRCGVCGVSDSGGVCQDRTSLPDGTPCCHSECVANTCTKVFGQGADQCTTSAQCAVAVIQPTARPVIPTSTPKPAAPVAGVEVPWYVVAVPLIIVLVGLIL
jgi:hypothetical protein